MENTTLIWELKKAIIEVEVEKSKLIRENSSYPSAELQATIEAQNQKIQSLERNLKILLEDK